MFRLQNPEYLWLLLAVPLVLGIFLWYWNRRRAALEQFADRELIEQLAPGINRRLPWTKFLLLLLSIPLLSFAMTNPQWAAERQEVKRRGIDIVIGLDVSNSMLAQDIQPSRMERSRYFASTLVDELVGNNIGVELFTCTSLMQAPLTTDYAFVKSVISSAGPYQISAQGTNLAEAIERAEEAYEDESANHRALILISDGEDHDGSAAAAASKANDAGLLIYTVGVGKQEGSFMPLDLPNGRKDYVRTSSGGPATTNADPATLEAIASQGGGKYYPLSGDSKALAEAIRSHVDRIEKQEFESQSFSTYDSYFYYFLAPALLLLLVEFSIGRKDRKRAAELEI
ncbi:MAG: Ca-activated chloride channel family protein [Neolewinella sp.]|jgi:Ca-activated chloride channel family protein